MSFTVAKGEIFGILGRNGAGKTTTVECVQGLRRPDTGRVRVLGLDPQTDGQRLRRRIGCQLQESALPDRIRVWEALRLFSSSASGASRNRNWTKTLEQWGLADKRKATFASLSGGQRQRLFIALALVNDPEVVFLDELTQGLDPAARHVTWDLVRAVRDRGATVVLVTHYMDEAEALCDRLTIVHQGRAVATGTPHELVALARGRTTIRFSVDRISGHGSGATSIDGGTVHRRSDGYGVINVTGGERSGRSRAGGGGGGGGDIGGLSWGDLSWLKNVPHVEAVTWEGLTVSIQGDGPVLPLVAAALVNRGIVPTDMRAEQPGLEDAFLQLTGEQLEELQAGERPDERVGER